MSVNAYSRGLSLFALGGSRGMDWSRAALESDGHQ